MDILHLAAPRRNVPVTFTLDRMRKLLVLWALLTVVIASVGFGAYLGAAYVGTLEKQGVISGYSGVSAFLFSLAQPFFWPFLRELPAESRAGAVLVLATCFALKALVVAAVVLALNRLRRLEVRHGN